MQRIEAMINFLMSMGPFKDQEYNNEVPASIPKNKKNAHWGEPMGVL